jgi:transposase
MNGDNDGTETRTPRPGRQQSGDNGVDARGLQSGSGGRDGSRRGKRVADLDWDSPIGGERTLARVSTDAVKASEPVEKRIEVTNVRQTPDDALAKADADDALYYLSKRNHVPSQWQDYAKRVPEKVTEQSDTIVERLDATYRNQIWPDDLSKAPRTWDGDEDVTGTVKDWVDDVMERMDPLHDQYSGVPALASLTVQKVIRKSLTQPQGWSVKSVANNLQTEFDWMGQDQADRIARQEVAAVLNTAKSVMLRAAEPTDETWLFRWEGPDDVHTSKICEAVKEEVESRGGAVPFDVLEDILYEKAREFDGDGGTPHRVEELVPHYGCRRTIVRVDG